MILFGERRPMPSHPEARHEIFNETNRDEITADVVVDWLAARSAGA